MRRVCTICARGGSKGVRGKNIRPLLGKPLLAYSLEQAQRSGLFDVIAVSSDQENILDVARQFGADYLIRRPDELATDQAAKLPAIIHGVCEVERLTGLSFDVCVDLDVTSPLRSVDDIVRAVALLESGEATNVITAAPARRSPYFNLIELTPEGQPVLSKTLDPPVVRRQDAPTCFDMNASIYVWTREALRCGGDLFGPQAKLYVMPQERSVDIDSALDFLLVELLMQRAHQQGG